MNQLFVGILLLLSLLLTSCEGGVTVSDNPTDTGNTDSGNPTDTGNSDTGTAVVISAPSNPTATPNNGVVRLNWSSSEAKHRVHYATSSFEGLAVAHYNRAVNYKSVDVTSGTNTVITNLTNDTQYYFVVTAIKDGQESDASHEVSTTPTLVLTSARQFNDTGIMFGGNYPSGNRTGNDCSGVDTNNANAPLAEQDCHQGRDAQVAAGTLTKVGAGHGGFDFTRLGANGQALPIQNGTWSDTGTENAGTKWSCVKDNHTGLVWEVKTNVIGIHHKNNNYQWGGLTAQGRDAATRFGTYRDEWNTLVNGTNNESL